MSGRVDTNSKSTISLTLGIFSIVLPLIGLVPGIIGLVFSRKTANENGRGLATAGFIFSIVGITIQSFGILAFITFNSITSFG
ncbi:DUF4190 domain-containing protein [Ornithinibacillus halotolerans]|uniref:DUF4190 domain-containing protein n=1 Tax=Ornithinibacillus halotolerans TaxID=1274357 RepID=A0A916S9G1_9BACI|nr:DUF4190 domain-containing protein [Ornithinibacillus halotolerans]GGA90662.1 hypothetical protein GCM10008025_36490 [Ornithinibacillus halotolerans]